MQHIVKIRTRKLSGFRLLAGALVLYGIYLIGGHYQQLCEVRKERAAAEVRLEQLQQQRQALFPAAGLDLPGGAEVGRDLRDRRGAVQARPSSGGIDRRLAVTALARSGDVPARRAKGQSG